VAVTSIYQEVLGDEFERLHPKMQWRFGFSSADGVCQIGRGVMHEVWRGPFWTLPFLLLGSTRRVLFPDRGRDVPFTISNYAYVDSFGRETVTWSRRFQLRRRYRSFDATMVHCPERGTIVDYLGTHQHLAVDIDLEADPGGGLRLRSGEQRFYERRVAFRFPLALSGVAEVHEWWDEAEERFRISVEVGNRRLGRLFGYRGWFEVEEVECAPGAVPAGVRPVREERRE
jgi:hypothetical protein